MLIDYSVLRPPMSLLKAAGVTAVGRYIGWDGEPGFQDIHKNLTIAEKSALLTAGIQIWLSFEYAADAALSGATQGIKDVQLASRQLRDLGMAAPGTAVYYAVDFDLGDYAPALPETPANARAKLGPVARYFDAIHATHPNHEIDGYGGEWALTPPPPPRPVKNDTQGTASSDRRREPPRQRRGADKPRRAGYGWVRRERGPAGGAPPGAHPGFGRRRRDPPPRRRRRLRPVPPASTARALHPVR